MKVDLSVVLWS